MGRTLYHSPGENCSPPPSFKAVVLCWMVGTSGSFPSGAKSGSRGRDFNWDGNIGGEVNPSPNQAHSAASLKRKRHVHFSVKLTDLTYSEKD